MMRKIGDRISDEMENNNWKQLVKTMDRAPFELAYAGICMPLILSRNLAYLRPLVQSLTRDHGGL